MKSYVIKGGIAGRERLRLLSRVMAPTTNALFDRIGVVEGASCLDVGCGGGDVALELARRAGPTGHVVGLDADETKLEIARREAETLAVGNLEFRCADVTKPFEKGRFDLVYARFLLTHMPRPERVIDNMLVALRPGGVVVVEDIDFSGHFCHPHCDAFWRYVELYAAVARKRGVDPDIGPRLPALLRQGGAAAVQISAVQPSGLRGEVKQVARITMETIADAVIGEGLATATEISGIVAELERYAEDATTVMSIPRVVQSWGYQA